MIYVSESYKDRFYYLHINKSGCRIFTINGILDLKLPHIDDGSLADRVTWTGDGAQQFHLAADRDEMEIDSGRGRSLTTDGADTIRLGM